MGGVRLIDRLLNRILKNNTGYAIFEIRTPKVKLYNLLMTINIIRIANKYSARKHFLKFQKEKPLEYNKLIDTMINDIDRFLVFGY